MSKAPKLSFEYVKPAILSDLKAGIAPCLMGAPGIGKSTIIESLADETNTKLFKVACNQLATKEDLTGSRIVELKDVDSTNPADKFTQIMFPQTSIAESIKYASEHPDENPILYLDEINRVSEDVTSACLSLVTDRRIGDVKLPDNLRIISAGNDEGNVAALDTASITRFSIYHVSADMDGWLASQPDLNPFVLKAIRDNSDHDFIGDESYYQSETSQAPEMDSNEDEDFEQTNVSFTFEDESISQMAVPRTITYTSNWLNTLGFNTDNPSQLDQKLVAQYKPLLMDVSTGDPDNGDITNTVFYQLLSAHSGDTQFTKALFRAIAEVFVIAERNGKPNAQQNGPISSDLPDNDSVAFATNFVQVVQSQYDWSADGFEQAIAAFTQNGESHELLKLFVNLFYQHTSAETSNVLSEAANNNNSSLLETETMYLSGFNDITFTDLGVDETAFTRQSANWLMTQSARISGPAYHLLSEPQTNANPHTVLATMKTINATLKAV